MIYVEAAVSDDVQLKSASIQLLNENLTPAQSILKTAAQGKKFSLSLNYEIYDPDLSSGNYYLKISASDGENDSKEYVKIFISGTPTVRTGLIVVSGQSQYQVRISVLDSSFTPSEFATLSCDYTSSCVSSKYQYVNILGETTCGLNSFRVSNKAIQWNIPSVGSSPYFNHLDFYNQISYVCFNNGMIRGFDKDGSIRFSATTSGGNKPQKTFLHNSGLLAEESGPVNSRQLSLYYNTGYLAQYIPINVEVVAFFKLDDNHVFLFGNKNLQGEILLYKTGQNELWAPFSLPQGNTIREVEQINSGTYLVALEDAIYKYDYSPVNFSKHIDRPNVEKIEFDEINNLVLVSEGNVIEEYAYSEGQLLRTYAHTELVRDIHLLFSR